MMTTPGSDPGSSFVSPRSPAYARPWAALAIAVIGGLVVVLILQTYPGLREAMIAWQGWVASLVDLVVISAPLVVATILAGSVAASGGVARATGIRHWRVTDVLLGLSVGVVVRAGVELISPTVGTLGGPLADALPLATIVVLVLGATLVSPFVEEWFFRGLVLRALVDGLDGAGRVLAAVVAILVSTAAFAALHFVTAGANVPLGLLVGTVGVGVGCGILAVVTGRIGGAIVAHTTFNAIGVVLLLM